MSLPLYIVGYDVCDHKRLRRVCQLLKDYAVGGQKSAYECYLSPDEKKQLIERLKQLISDEDSVVLIQLPPDPVVAFLGVAELPPDTGTYYFG